MPKSSKRSATLSDTSKSGPSKRGEARQICVPSCLPGFSFSGFSLLFSHQRPFGVDALSRSGVARLKPNSALLTVLDVGSNASSCPLDRHAPRAPRLGRPPSFRGGGVGRGSTEFAEVLALPAQERASTGNQKPETRSQKRVQPFVSVAKPIKFEDFLYAFGGRRSVRHR